MEPEYCSKSELDACRTVMESQAKALHRHSTARTDAALQELSQGIAGHLETSLAKKVDWEAMKTTLDSQIRTVFRVQLQGLMKEVEQRVLDTLQAHHRGEVEAEHSSELSLAPAMSDIVDAIERMDQTASTVASIDNKVDEVVQSGLASQLAMKHEFAELQSAVMSRVDVGVRDVREELQSAIASVPNIVKDLSEKQHADEGQSTFKRLVDHVEGVASTMRARQTEHERRFRQAVADIEENRRALDDMTARVEQRLDALEASANASTDLRHDVDVLQLQSRKLVDDVKKFQGQADSRADVDRQNMGATNALDKRLAIIEADLAKTSKGLGARWRDIDVKIGEVRREASKATKELQSHFGSALAETELKIDRAVSQAPNRRSGANPLASLAGLASGAKMNEMVAQLNAHDAKLTELSELCVQQTDAQSAPSTVQNTIAEAPPAQVASSHKLWESVTRLDTDASLTRDTLARLEAKFEGSQQNLAGLRTELLELAHNLISFSGEVRQEVADSRAQVSAKIEALADGMPSIPLADATTTTFSPAQPARIDTAASPKPSDPTPINEAMLDAKCLQLREQMSVDLASLRDQMEEAIDASLDVRCEPLQEAIDALSQSQRSSERQNSEARGRESELLKAKIDRGHRDAEAQVTALLKQLRACASQQSVDETHVKCGKLEQDITRHAGEVRTQSNEILATLGGHTKELALLWKKTDAAEKRVTDVSAATDALMYELARSQSAARLAAYDGEPHDRAVAPGAVHPEASRARPKRGRHARSLPSLS